MDQPLKILHIASEKTWRGGENQIRLLMEGLRARGHEPFLAADPGSEILRRLGKKFPSVAAPMARISWPATVLRLHRFCRRHGITLIDAHSSKAHDVGLGLVTLDRRRRLIVHRRVDYPVGRPYAPLKYRTSKVARYVAISNAIAEVLRRAGIDASRIVTVRSAVEAEPHQGIDRASARESLRHMLGLPRDTLLIGNASALSEQKGYGYLMSACALLRDSPEFKGLNFHCVIAGDGPLRDALEQQRIALNLDNHVSFLGFIAKVPEFLAALDIFAMTSIDEGLGTSALDAAHAGCAIIASNVGGLPEIISNNESGLLVPPRDPAAIAAAITRLAHAPELRAAFARAVHEKVLREFSVDSMVEGNLRVYESVFQT